ncbi:hypothetical protein FBZ93_10549 [Bradyrhizobium macuxiense]|uniref:Uncharacterized protein n=1 Tax=Bradyrhizobium macuxiense TaxID=1755647 RepID=A0A560LXQ8_9BRAD|nr:hypothetical protein FBZ93_10549 [Bradyrhizobium macuxiense]
MRKLIHTVLPSRPPSSRLAPAQAVTLCSQLPTRLLRHNRPLLPLRLRPRSPRQHASHLVTSSHIRHRESDATKVPASPGGRTMTVAVIA